MKSLTTPALCNKDPKKFALLLRKGIYLYEYMDSWERFIEESLPDKEYLYSKLNKEGITDEQYEHALKSMEGINIKNLGKYHDLYVQSDITLLGDVFEMYRNIRTRFCTLFISSRISMGSLLKNDLSKIRVIN